MMRGWVRRPLKRFVNAATEARRSDRDRRALAWIAGGNDRTLRQEYDLGPQSLVFDLGGYEGQWASDIVARYLCHVQVFEPVVAMADGIRQRFAGNQLVEVHDFGLGPATTGATIWLDGDSSSVVRAAPPRTNSQQLAEEVRLVMFEDFIQERGISAIDLMKINIEGAEYELLEHLLDTGAVDVIGNIQVQFHDFVPDAERRMRDIQSGLARTHDLTYQSLFVWENWRRRA
jgi:FkbM family methyltransferase